MKITVVCVGKSKEQFFTDAVNEYVKRLTRYVKPEIIQVEDEKHQKMQASGSPAIKRKEGERILKKYRTMPMYLLWRYEGVSFSSVELADKDKQSPGAFRPGAIVFCNQYGVPQQLGNEQGRLNSLADRHSRICFSGSCWLNRFTGSYRIINGEP